MDTISYRALRIGHVLWSICEAILRRLRSVSIFGWWGRLLSTSFWLFLALSLAGAMVGPTAHAACNLVANNTCYEREGFYVSAPLAVAACDAEFGGDCSGLFGGGFETWGYPDYSGMQTRAWYICHSILDDPACGGPGYAAIEHDFVIGVSGAQCSDPIFAGTGVVGQCLEEAPGMEDGPSSCSDTPGVQTPNPINFATGNKYQAESDFAGSGPLALEVERHYNSRSGVWQMPYQRALSFIGAGLVVATNDSGAQATFETDGSGGWTPLHGDGRRSLSFDGVAGEWTLVTESNDVEVYDTTGVQQSVTNRAGQSIQFTYDGSGRLQTATHFTGRALTFEYDATDRLEFVRHSGLAVDNFLAKYEYDASDRLTAVVYPDDDQTNLADNPRKTYHYEDVNFPNALTGITDENGDRFATYAYDSNGRAISSDHAGVESYTITNNPDGTVSVTNPLSKQTDYTLTQQLGRTKITQVDGLPTAFCGATTRAITYDSLGFVDTRTDENGNVTDFTYNARGLVESRTDAVGLPEQRTTTTTWHASFRVPTQIVKPGQTIDMTYDSAGRLLTRTITDTQTQSIPYTTSGNTHVTTFTYNALGLVATIDGPRTGVSDVTTFAYDVNDELTTTTNALGHVTTIVTRDARGLPTQISDENSVTTDLVYDARGRLTSRTVNSSQGGAISTFVYDDVGQLTQTTLPDGSELNYEYDAAHRPTAIENGLGERIEYALDNAGNRTTEEVVDAGSAIVRTQTRVFDELSRLREAIGAASQTTEFDYDNNGNPTSITDGLLNITSHSFDPLDRLITVTDPNLNDVNYGYDDRDNLTDVTDPRGLTTDFVYDGLDNLIQEDSADAGTIVNEYDDAGNLTRSTDARGVVADYTYDALNRVLTISYPTNPSDDIAYTYDQGASGDGRLSSLTDATGSTTYTYDDRGNLTGETRVIDGDTYVTNYAYDLADNLTQMTYPSGRTIDYARDSLGRITSVTTQVSGGPVETVADSFAYLPFGPGASWDAGNGISSTMTFDLDYRVTDIDVGTVMDRAYAYNAVDNITGITDNLDANRSQTFFYDDLYRLTDATGVYGDIDYGYDAVGNRLTRSIVDGASTITETLSYDIGSNRLVSVDRDDNGAQTTRTLGYSTAGNLDDDTRHDGSQRTLTYNDRNRLISVVDGSGTLGTYNQNALGQRVTKTAATGTTHFHYDQTGQLIAESDGSGSAIREYVYANGTLLGLIAATSGGGGTVETLTLDTEDATVQILGTWPTSTAIPGWLGANYQFHVANGPLPGAIVIDNPFATFFGTWPNSTAIAGWEGADYQFHQANQPSPDSVMVDNSAGSSTGTWPTSTSVSGYVGSNYQFHAPGSGSDQFTWSLSIAQDGDYEVFATWTSHANRAPDANFTIHHVDALDQPTTSSVSVDQRSNGGGRENLGTYRFLAGSATVTLDQSVNGYAIADEVSVTPAGALPNRAEWSFTATNAGDYLISAKWTVHPNRASNARYVIDYVDNASGLAQSQAVVVNQQIDGGQFNALATLDLQAGSVLTVTLSDEANGFVIADAVQLVEVANSSPNQVTWPFTLTQSGTYEVYARWTAHPNRASNATYAITNGATTQQALVNQQVDGGDWQLLTTLTLDATNPVEVTLTDVANGYVIADGVELRRQGSGGSAALNFVHNDHLGTPQVVTDGTSTVVWQADYKPFGEVDETVSTVAQPVRFPGQYHDVETALNYNYFRDYDPRSGRYVQSDPIGLAGSLNSYGYANHSPTNLVDILGLIADCVRHYLKPRITRRIVEKNRRGTWTRELDFTIAGINPGLGIDPRRRQLRPGFDLVIQAWLVKRFKGIVDLYNETKVFDRFIANCTQTIDLGCGKTRELNTSREFEELANTYEEFIGQQRVNREWREFLYEFYWPF